MLGGITMGISIYKTGQLIRDIPHSAHARTWRILRWFMLSFFFGYAAAACLLFMGHEDIVQAPTGVIFFLGAVFVLIVVVAGKRTISELRSTLMSVEDKDVMLKEIHHRVKNNLQIIKSLLKLQSHHITDKKVLELYEESDNRIMSMALIHEMLYRSDSLSHVDVQTYVDQLVRNIIAAYELDIHLDLDIQINVDELNIDSLTPLGLILNEIISNSIKHGFVGRDSGGIFIYLDRVEKKQFKLLIGDTGVGYQIDSVDPEEQGLGTELIHLLTEQLEGRLTQIKGPGTRYEIIFKELETKRGV